MDLTKYACPAGHRTLRDSVSGTTIAFCMTCQMNVYHSKLVQVAGVNPTPPAQPCPALTDLVHRSCGRSDVSRSVGRLQCNPCVAKLTYQSIGNSATEVRWSDVFDFVPTGPTGPATTAPAPVARPRNDELECKQCNGVGNIRVRNSDGAIYCGYSNHAATIVLPADWALAFNHVPANIFSIPFGGVNTTPPAAGVQAAVAQAQQAAGMPTTTTLGNLPAHTRLTTAQTYGTTHYVTVPKSYVSFSGEIVGFTDAPYKTPAKTCTTCGLGLSSELDAYYGRDPVAAGRCVKCRGRG